MGNYPRLRFKWELEGDIWHVRVGIRSPTGEHVLGVYWVGYRPVFFPDTLPKRAVYGQVYSVGQVARAMCAFNSTSEARRHFKMLYQQWREGRVIDALLREEPWSAR